MRRAKIKIHEAEAITAEDGEEEPEIEYMPPREVPLPDYPDDWPHDRTYPQFEGKNLTRGWWSEFATQKNGNDDEEFSDFEEKLKRIEELNEKKKQQALQAKKATAVKKTPLAKTTRDPLTAKPPQALSSKNAAAALSKPTKSSSAGTTSIAKAPPTSTVASKKPIGSTIVAGNSRHTAAKVASNSTLGYSKGRAVSATARKPLSGLHKDDSAAENESSSADKTTSSRPKTLDELFDLQDLSFGDDSDGAFEGYVVNDVNGLVEEDDELQDFQLGPVEL